MLSRARLAVKFTDKIAFKPRENSDFVALTQVVFQTASVQLGLRLSYERVYHYSRTTTQSRLRISRYVRRARYLRNAADMAVAMRRYLRRMR